MFSIYNYDIIRVVQNSPPSILPLTLHCFWLQILQQSHNKSKRHSML